MVKFCVRNVMVVDKFHETTSFKQSNWLEKIIKLKTQKWKQAKTEFEKDFNELMNNAAFGKFVENVRNRIIIEFIKNCENDKILKQQSKLTFNGIHKSYTSYSSYSFKHNEVVMDKPKNVGFAILELSMLHGLET